MAGDAHDGPDRRSSDRESDEEPESQDEPVDAGESVDADEPEERDGWISDPESVG